MRAFINGNYRITILKISDRIAKVKVTRASRKGLRTSFSATTGELHVYDGFVIKEDVPVLDDRQFELHFEGVHVNVSAERSFGDSLEIGYQYNLRDKDARRAYERALMGRLGLSDDLAAKSKSMKDKAPVQFLFHRDTDDRSTAHNSEIAILITKRQGQASSRIERADVVFPEGKVQTFTATSHNGFTKRTSFLGLWGNKEEIDYDIKIQEQVQIPSLETNWGLVSHGRIEDDDTRGLELNTYTKMVESLFSDQEIFPKVPIVMPTDLNQQNNQSEGQAEPAPQPTRFGRSSLYYKFSLTSAQLMAFAKTPQADMWKYLEKGFGRFESSWTRHPSDRFMARIVGVPMDYLSFLFSYSDITARFGAGIVHANKFRKNWIKLQELAGRGEQYWNSAEGGQAAVELLGKMMADRTFTYELSKTVLLALREQGVRDISFRVSAHVSPAAPTSRTSAGTRAIRISLFPISMCNRSPARKFASPSTLLSSRREW